MDKVWAHETYTSFIGPLSTTVVVGWDDVRKAWQMRFGQFDSVTISMDDPHVRISGDAGWAVCMEKVGLLRKDGKTIAFDAFVTNVFEKRGGQWLLVAPKQRRFSRRRNDHVPSDLLSTIRASRRSIAPACSRSASVR